MASNSDGRSAVWEGTCPFPLSKVLRPESTPVAPGAIGDGEGEHTIDKRHVSVLARLGQLPYQGKRMEKSSLDELAERLEEEQHAKRYLGSLARAGELRAARDQEGKRDDFEGLVSDLAAEEMRRSRLGESPLKDDILVLPQAGGFRQFDEDDEEISGEKRSSMAVLARTGALPKRVLDEEDMDDDMNEEKRGLSSIARNGYFQKRIGDDDLEQLMSEVYGIGEKRNVASLARGFQLPQNGKRNIASIVRDRSKKESYEEDMDEEKRNLPSIVRDRNEPLGEGKRHIGAFVANHGIPFVNNEKRNIGSLAKNRLSQFTISKRETNEATDNRRVRLTNNDEVELKGPTVEEQSKDHLSQVSKDDHDEDHSRSKREASAPDMEKRYFGVRGGGKMPGGRLPKVGSRSRSRHDNSGRRRH
ncbi:Hypothetical protein NTJ_04366 [Nesidiocoris tenuis]|uniref:Uncharacterized protein n=1 Tax=Nesidiocoris tenuis TaxID=355587 RepID=A0ABN7AH24_9HEMI|nr:Hypothetical protein NTJ_04366 [Nesidiocoris tenuis]